MGILVSSLIPPLRSSVQGSGIKASAPPERQADFALRCASLVSATSPAYSLPWRSAIPVARASPGGRIARGDRHPTKSDPPLRRCATSSPASRCTSGSARPLTQLGGLVADDHASPRWRLRPRYAAPRRARGARRSRTRRSASLRRAAGRGAPPSPHDRGRRAVGRACRLSPPIRWRRTAEPATHGAQRRAALRRPTISACASRALPGFEMVDLAQSCCAAHAAAPPARTDNELNSEGGTKVGRLFDLGARIRSGGDSFRCSVMLYGPMHQGTRKLPYGLSLLKGKGETILIDTGYDHVGYGKTLAESYGVSATSTSRRSVLAECGVRPEDVTTVFITHAHFDHMGALDHFPERQVLHPAARTRQMGLGADAGPGVPLPGRRHRSRRHRQGRGTRPAGPDDRRSTATARTCCPASTSILPPTPTPTARCT